MVLDGADQEWIWNPPCDVICERQVYHRDALVKNGGDEEPSTPFNAIMYAIIKSMVSYHRGPTSAMSNRLWDNIAEVGGTDPGDEFYRESAIEWIPRSGSQKSGLQGVHGKDRKRAAMKKGPEFMRANGCFDTENWARTIKKASKYHKPFEDICDSYLQACHYLTEWQSRQQLESRKVVRAVGAQQKREAKAERALVREAKRKRKAEADVDELTDDNNDSAPRKKKRRKIAPPAFVPIADTDRTTSPIMEPTTSTVSTNGRAFIDLATPSTITDKWPV